MASPGNRHCANCVGTLCSLLSRWRPIFSRFYVAKVTTVRCDFASDTGAEHVCLFVCLCVCLSVREHICGTTRPNFTTFISRVSYSRGSGDVAIRYVFPVSWMTTYLHIMDYMEAASSRRRVQDNTPAASYWLRRVLDDGRDCTTVHRASDACRERSLQC